MHTLLCAWNFSAKLFSDVGILNLIKIISMGCPWLVLQGNISVGYDWQCLDIGKTIFPPPTHTHRYFTVSSAVQAKWLRRIVLSIKTGEGMPHRMQSIWTRQIPPDQLIKCVRSWPWQMLSWDKRENFKTGPDKDNSKPPQLWAGMAFHKEIWTQLDMLKYDTQMWGDIGER